MSNGGVSTVGRTASKVSLRITISRSSVALQLPPSAWQTVVQDSPNSPASQPGGLFVTEFDEVLVVEEMEVVEVVVK